MKMKDVPQDQDPSFEGHKKLCYAIDDQGKFAATKTSGWNVEAEAKNLAWKSIHDDLEKTRLQIKNGQLSPLAYYMKHRLMDRSLLAQNMGISSWRVWWHLRPAPFSKLSEAWLQRYADCLEISVSELRTFNGE